MCVCLCIFVIKAIKDEVMKLIGNERDMRGVGKGNPQPHPTPTQTKGKINRNLKKKKLEGSEANEATRGHSRNLLKVSIA